MRGVMGELRPQALDDYGLLAALRSHAAAFALRTGIHAEVTGSDQRGRLPKAVELALYRIAQEALNNVAKHAKATAVTISFDGVHGGARLALGDDGVGFEPERVATATGWGLAIMRERAEAIGAAFDLEAAPGRGVRIVVRCVD